MDPVFYAYSKRFLITKLKAVSPSFFVNHSSARSVRVLWYMEKMGGGYYSFHDLSCIGAGQWRALNYALPDLVKDGLIDLIKVTKPSGRVAVRYRINSSGKSFLKEVDNHIRDEYQKALDRIEKFNER